MEIWGLIGVQVCESAMQLFEKSKRTLVGNGSYRGFLAAVLNQVINAAPLAQTGSAVQKRISDILPDDVAEVSDAKFKGHKGIQMHNLHVGAKEPLVGLVEEFEAKESKVRVFKANQHVGQ
ncbi:hypothetical protein BDQ17DRAFT_1371701 [Cyathus striatus]|nr:hypothetical protein BDQ17DRAFT_1371701 [Cyathus striatus]